MRRAAKVIALRGLPALACLALLGVWFFLLRPAALGGPASYVIVAGRSMEPGLQMHDLAIVRKQDSYGVGDVIAFRVPEGEVIHRIVGGNADGGFLVKGDNNEEPDLWRPRPSDIEGALWLRVPAGGRALEFLAQPANAAIAAGSLAAFWLLVGGDIELPSMRRRQNGRIPAPVDTAPRPPGRWRGRH